ncbi:MAG: DUF1015 domain-containing protein, partial [Mucinivorans sp.]
MVRIKPFKGIRPPREMAAEVASRPYDVLSSEEARAEAPRRSILHITKPEIDFPTLIDEHSAEAYQKAVDNFKLWKQNGWLLQDETPHYYIYAQTMDERTQYGLVACCHFEDYLDGTIKKHELTRKDKEQDRMKHVQAQNANIEPVFFSYPAVEEVDAIVADIVKGKAEYDFESEDGFFHKFWVIHDEATAQHI